MLLHLVFMVLGTRPRSFIYANSGDAPCFFFASTTELFTRVPLSIGAFHGRRDIRHFRPILMIYYCYLRHCYLWVSFIHTHFISIQSATNTPIEREWRARILLCCHEAVRSRYQRRRVDLLLYYNLLEILSPLYTR